MLLYCFLYLCFILFYILSSYFINIYNNTMKTCVFYALFLFILVIKLFHRTIILMYTRLLLILSIIFDIVYVY